jgi:spermidine/putrescine transport system substrate-binding protein
MTNQINAGRRSFLKRGAGLAVVGMGGMAGARTALSQSAGATKSALNGFIFCHTMGSAADVAKFKAATNIDMNATCWSTSLDTLSRIVSGGGKIFDIFSSSRQFIPPLVSRNVLAPIDFSKIPNAKFLAPEFADPSYSTVGDKHYSLPFMFGYDSILYNRKKIENVDSYGILFDEKYKGQVAIKDDPQLSIMQTALFLGYADPYKLTSKDLKDITDFLIKKKPIFRKLWSGFAEVISLMKNEEVVAVGDGWISMAWTLNKGGMDTALALPKEKALVWTFDWVMPKEVIERGMDETVYAFMNWSLSPEQTANMARSVGYVSPAMTGVKLLTPEEAKVTGYTDYENIIRNGLQMSQFPENIQEWNDAWTRFKAA